MARDGVTTFGYCTKHKALSQARCEMSVCDNYYLDNKRWLAVRMRKTCARTVYCLHGKPWFHGALAKVLIPLARRELKMHVQLGVEVQDSSRCSEGTRAQQNRNCVAPTCQVTIPPEMITEETWCSFSFESISNVTTVFVCGSFLKKRIVRAVVEMGPLRDGFVHDYRYLFFFWNHHEPEISFSFHTTFLPNFSCVLDNSWYIADHTCTTNLPCFFFLRLLFVMVSNAVDTMWFLRSAPSVNVVRNANKRGQKAGVTVTLVRGSQISWYLLWMSTWVKFKQALASLLAQCGSVLNFQSDGNSNKRLRDHWYSEGVQGCRSRRLPPCARVERVPEEQSRGTQEQTVAVEVISTIDEGWPGEHLHAARPVRRERLPAGALQRGLTCDPRVRRSRARSHRLRAVVGAARPWRALWQLSRNIRRRCILRIGKSDVYQQPIASLRSFEVDCCVPFFCPMPYHQSTGRAMSWTRRSTGRSRSWRWNHQVAERRRWQPQTRCV